MDSKIINGRALAQKREIELLEKLSGLNIKPKVVSILIGDDPPSLLYTQMKQKKAAELGIDFQYIHLPKTENFANVSMMILKLNNDLSVNGIMVQLPLPKEFLKGKKADELLSQIDSKKDVDGLTGKSQFLPAAVKAVMNIIEEENINLKGKFVAVLGTSKLVGLPLAEEFKKRGALVSSINRETPNIPQITQRADIIVSATGVANVLTGDMVKEGIIVIDVGTLVIEDELSENPKEVRGDVEFATVLPKASRITPVPGGVGPLTVISLMENVVEAASL